MVPHSYEQILPIQTSAGPTRLADERERSAQIGHAIPPLGDLRKRTAALSQATFDPRGQLAHGVRSRAIRRTLRQNHLDLGVRADVHAHPARASGASHGVLDRTVGLPALRSVLANLPLQFAHLASIGARAGDNDAVARSIVKLPAEVRSPYQVFLNGVPQQEGRDYQVKGSTLMFARELRKDKISKRRWLLGAWGVGTYKQDDSVDVRYEAADGSPRLAEALEIEVA
jgi:hypothetical protein